MHKTPIMRWLEPIAHLNWRAIVEQGCRYGSGTVAVAEKGGKVAGVWWYVLVAIDPVSGFPVHVALCPSNATSYCTLFLLQWNQ